MIDSTGKTHGIRFSSTPPMKASASAASTPTPARPEAGLGLALPAGAVGNKRAPSGIFRAATGRTGALNSTARCAPPQIDAAPAAVPIAALVAALVPVLVCATATPSSVAGNCAPSISASFSTYPVGVRYSSWRAGSSNCSTYGNTWTTGAGAEALSAALGASASSSVSSRSLPACCSVAEPPRQGAGCSASVRANSAACTPVPGVVCASTTGTCRSSVAVSGMQTSLHTSQSALARKFSVLPGGASAVGV